MDIEFVTPDDGTVFHKRYLRVQVGTWKIELLKQERNRKQIQ